MEDANSTENMNDVEKSARDEKSTAVFKKSEANRNDKSVLITPKFLKDHCRKNDLYMTARLNDVLYLHHKGFTEISGLDEYTGLKTLWLENNSIDKIQNLGHLSDLRCLFLQCNKIDAIANLDNLTRLTTLNLATNFICKIEGLKTLVNLHTLVLTGNKLKFTQDVEELRECQSISVLELSRNCLSEFGVIEVLSDMENLKVLTLTGNPVVRSTKDYRRVLLSQCSSLTYLDSRPVSEKERLGNDAWKAGGIEAERKFKEEWVRKEQEKIYNGVVAIMKMRDANLAKRGIDPSSVEDQIAAVEERGRELLQKYKEELGGKENARDVIREESKSNLEPLSASFNFVLENEQLAVPDLDAEDVANREAARERARAIVAKTAGDGSHDAFDINDAEDAGEIMAKNVKQLPALEYDGNEGSDHDKFNDDGVVNLDTAFKVPESPKIIKCDDDVQREEEDENSRLIYHLGSFANSYYDFDPPAEKAAQENHDKDHDNDKEQVVAAAEEEKVEDDDAKNEHEEDVKPQPKTEYLEVGGYDEDEGDGDLKSPRREKRDLIGIGTELDKLFRSHSPNPVKQQRRTAWEEEEDRKPDTPKKRVLIQELD